METKKLKELESEVEKIVGFDAVTKRGWEMSAEECTTLIEYLHIKKGYSKDYLKSHIGTRRPFDYAVSGFTEKCLICGSLRNYCCC
jgi:hypothetical protein